MSLRVIPMFFSFFLSLEEKINCEEDSLFFLRSIKQNKMTIPYEKMPCDESKYANENWMWYSFVVAPASSVILVDEPIQVHEVPVRIRHYFVFSLFSAICLCPATGEWSMKLSLLFECLMILFFSKVLLHWLIRWKVRLKLMWNFMIKLDFMLVVLYSGISYPFFSSLSSSLWYSIDLIVHQM